MRVQCVRLLLITTNGTLFFVVVGSLYRFLAAALKAALSEGLLNVRARVLSPFLFVHKHSIISETPSASPRSSPSLKTVPPCLRKSPRSPRLVFSGTLLARRLSVSSFSRPPKNRTGRRRLDSRSPSPNRRRRSWTPPFGPMAPGPMEGTKAHRRFDPLLLRYIRVTMVLLLLLLFSSSFVASL